MRIPALRPKGSSERHSYWEAVAGKGLRELISKEGCWLVGKGPAVPVGTAGLETEDFEADKQVGRAVDMVGYMLAGMGHQEEGVAGKD